LSIYYSNYPIHFSCKVKKKITNSGRRICEASVFIEYQPAIKLTEKDRYSIGAAKSSRKEYGGVIYSAH